MASIVRGIATRKPGSTPLPMAGGLATKPAERPGVMLPPEQRKRRASALIGTQSKLGG